MRLCIFGKKQTLWLEKKNIHSVSVHKQWQNEGEKCYQEVLIKIKQTHTFGILQSFVLWSREKCLLLCKILCNLSGQKYTNNIFVFMNLLVVMMPLRVETIWPSEVWAVTTAWYVWALSKLSTEISLLDTLVFNTGAWSCNRVTATSK